MNFLICSDRCNVDSTVRIHSPAHSRQFRFSMEAFKFIGLHDQVYISCSVLMCQAGDPNTRCSQGCLNPTLSNNPRNYKRKRAAVTQSTAHFISQGPLHLKRSVRSASDGTESPGINLNLNLVFIAGCLLAAVGMISGVAVYKAKISGVKYQPLPTLESQGSSVGRETIPY
uniref:CUB and zona pellucida-like domain-containing protein 1 n=1 Tax=Semicossyphus pulcher TaxID=241346 RepID=UPI0037E8042A